MSPREAAADDALHDEMIGGGCQSPANAKIELPLGRDVEIDRGKELVLLLADGIELGRGSGISVILDAARNLACQVVADFYIRIEFPAARNPGTVPCSREDRVESEVPGTVSLIDDGPQFVAPGIGREPALRVTEFLGDAEANRPVPLYGDRKPRTDMISHPLPPPVGLNAAENVEAGFEPVGEALRDFERLVHRVMGGLDTIDDAFAPVHGEVGMNLDHRRSRSDRFVAVYLNLVIVLSADEPG